MSSKLINKDIKNDLEFYPKLRERKNKNRYIAVKLERKHKTGIPVDVIAEIVAESLTYDRIWRYVLQNNPKLRGTDYVDKKPLAQDKMVDLGYQDGAGIAEFNQVIKDF